MHEENSSKSKFIIPNIICLLSVVLIIILLSNSVRAEEKGSAKWQENVPILNISYDVEVHGMYEIYYNYSQYLSDGDNFSRFENIHLLMVNGGFVPHNNIIIKNSRTMVPTTIIEDIFGATIDCDKEGQTVKITVSDTIIIFNFNTGDAELNGKRHDIEASPFFRDSKIYVPLKFIADALGADTQYKKDLLFLYEKKMPSFRKEFLGDLEYFDIVIIETGTKDKDVFTVQDGIDSLKKAATEIYGESHMFRGYDMHDIEYINQDLGRYYIYVVNGFENEPIYFNKYTGEIFSSPGGSIPYFIIIDGFLYKPVN